MVDLNPIYLDYNATTPILPEVVDAMLPYLREHFGNPSSSHVYGQRTHKAVERAREQVAALIGCEADEIFFTSGGTEANNLAIRGVTERNPDRKQVVTTAVEHPATSRPCAWLAQHGYHIEAVGVDADGRARIADAERTIYGNTALVTVMHSNNETGVLQPIAELSRLAHAAGTIIHTDAAQSVGKVHVNVRDLDVDLLSIAGHKLYAPKGVGALYIRRGTAIAPFALGASHERGLRPGTENVASIVALGVACLAAGRDLEANAQRTRALRDALWQKLQAGIPQLKLNGHFELRLPNTLNVRFPRVSGNAVLAAAPRIAASTGSACHSSTALTTGSSTVPTAGSGGESASAVILAMGVSPEDALGSVRLTLGRATTQQEIEDAAQALIRSWHALAAGTD